MGLTVYPPANAMIQMFTLRSFSCLLSRASSWLGEVGWGEHI